MPDSELQPSSELTDATQPLQEKEQVEGILASSPAAEVPDETPGSSVSLAGSTEQDKADNPPISPMSDSKLQPPSESTEATQPPPEKERAKETLPQSPAAVYIAPAEVPDETPGRSVFLAGSIEQDKADNWQPRITEQLRDITCTIFNPRREKWDPNWIQRASNPVFRDQVKWELKLLKRADVIAMYFDPETESPITLLELGLFSEAKDEKGRPKLILACPEKFYRIGNVEIVCEKAGIVVIDTYDQFVVEVRKRLGRFDEILPIETGKEKKKDGKDDENTESETKQEGVENRGAESVSVKVGFESKVGRAEALKC